MGVDTLVLSRTASSSTYVERDDELCQLARYNFELLDADVAVVHSTAEDYLHTITEGQYDWLYIDPSRRVGGNKKTTITNLEPDLCAIEQQMLAVAPHILVKLSPMQDISEAIRTLSAVREVHIVSVSHDVKELLVVQERGYVGEVSIVAVDLTPDAAPSVYTATSGEMHSHCAVGPVQSWLYQPQPAVVKAQLHDHQARAYGLTKLHANTQLYSSAVLRSDYSGRIFEVMGTVPMQQKAMRSVVPSGKANIISKNHPLTPAQIAKKLKLVQGGQDYLIAVTDYAEQKVLLHCNRIQ